MRDQQNLLTLKKAILEKDLAVKKGEREITRCLFWGTV